LHAPLPDRDAAHVEVDVEHFSASISLGRIPVKNAVVK
jgi:hypothetical protein